MEFLEMYVIHEDPRGVFRGITNKYTWGEINYIETCKDVVRGNHYHKFTKELFYILEGRVQIVIRNLYNGEVHEFEAGPKSVFIVDPYEVHTFTTLEDAKWLNMLSHSLAEDAPDIYPFEKPRDT
jgi:dTDP-4-dehydrorhamnose 3,5-epimerase-like enzyme